jgi:hypothetical protein
MLRAEPANRSLAGGEIEDDLKSPIRQDVFPAANYCCAFVMPDTFHNGR